MFQKLGKDNLAALSDEESDKDEEPAEDWSSSEETNVIKGVLSC